ncbi:hypothetical protein Golomagni_07364 [Golovinomyces magnicellulatus]|nr:hypothetical protein Golomagni_07364 [Golovinomyces magnicellulatus]
MTSQPDFIPNDMAMMTLPSAPSAMFQLSLEQLLEKLPPPQKFGTEHLFGLFGGCTGMALMMLELSKMYPDVRVKGYSLGQLAAKYVEGDRDGVNVEELMPGNFGISNEELCFAAMKACLSGSPQDATTFVDLMVPFLTDRKREPDEKAEPFLTELVFGAAGALYLLRMVKHWVPSTAAEIDPVIKQFIDKLLQVSNHGKEFWTFAGKKYTGAAHGEIGNITQIVLSDPSRAQQLMPQLRRLLDLQLPNGNWPVEVGVDKVSEKVQFCHGVVGIIFSLRALREYYPAMQEELDVAIGKAQQVVWNEGLLCKEPSLCHGILGNAL